MTAALFFLVTWSDVLLLGYFARPADVAVYGMAARVIVVGTFLLQSFQASFSPMISGLHAAGQHAQLQALYRRVSTWTFTLSLPLFLSTIVMAPLLMSVFGPRYVVGAGALMVLAVGELCNALTGPTEGMVLMPGRPYARPSDAPIAPNRTS